MAQTRTNILYNRSLCLRGSARKGRIALSPPGTACSSAHSGSCLFPCAEGAAWGVTAWSERRATSLVVKCVPLSHSALLPFCSSALLPKLLPRPVPGARGPRNPTAVPAPRSDSRSCDFETSSRPTATSDAKQAYQCQIGVAVQHTRSYSALVPESFANRQNSWASQCPCKMKRCKRFVSPQKSHWGALLIRYSF